VHNAAPVHLEGNLGRRPLNRPDRVRVEKAQFHRVIRGIGQDRAVPASRARGRVLAVHQASRLDEHPPGGYGLGQADTGPLLRATQASTSATSSGGSERCLVLNPHRTSARRMLASSGRPRTSASIAGVAAVSARAMSFRYLAEACFHFMSTYAQANSYQVVAALRRSHAAGLPVVMPNASPFRATVSRALRKLSACAAVRKPSFHSLPPTFHRTLYVVTSAPL